MKAISAVIAIIMLLMITVALVGLIYVWITTLTTTTTGAGTEQVEKTTEAMLKPISLIVSKCSNISSVNAINFTIKNVGTKDIKAGELSAFVDEVSILTDPDITTSTLSVGGQEAFNIETTDQEATRVLKVSGPANTIEKTLDCE